MVVFTDEKTCTQCPTTMPRDCFPPNGRAKDGTPRRHPYCYPCKRRVWNETISPERRRERSRATYRKKMADPEERAKLQREWNAAKRRQLKADPEGFRKRNAAATKRYRDKIMANPVLAARMRQDKRIDDTLRRRRLGMRPIRREVRDREFEKFPRLPVAPLAEFLRAEIRKLEENGIEGARGIVSARCGVDPRKVHSWLTGELETMQFDTADKILVSLDLLPWDIWDEVEHPEVMAAFLGD